MEKHLNEQRYDSYIQNKSIVWSNKFIWNGIDGRSPKCAISIINYAKETGALDNILVNKANDMYNVIDRLSNDYCQWIIGKDQSYTSEELNCLRYFFIGSLGEFFFTHYINEVKCMLIKKKSTDKCVERYDFKYVCPRLNNETDFGVDLTGMVSNRDKYYPCVLQVKFWNPYNHRNITNAIAQSAHSDGICNGFINDDDDKNIVICWLGNTSNVSKWLEENKKLYSHIIYIDSIALNYSINEKMPDFWKSLNNEFAQIKNF